MLNLAILWFLLTNSTVPAPSWCWTFWWIMLVFWIINTIVSFIKLGMELK